MSFDQLPDELIAHIACFLSYKEIARLVQSQKRMRNVLNKYKMDRTHIDELVIDFDYNSWIPNTQPHMTCKFIFEWKAHCFSIHPEKLERSKSDAIFYAISKFRSITHLHITGIRLMLDRDFNRRLTDSTTKIEEINLGFSESKLTAKEFVAFCKRYSQISMYGSLPQQFFTDDILCQIFATCEFNIRARVRFEHLNTSDRVIDAMLNGRLPTKFGLDWGLTTFTVAGIRKFSEVLMGREEDYTIGFGIIPNDRKAEALAWLNYANNNPNLPYTMETDEDSRTYNVKKRSPSKTSIEFVFPDSDSDDE